MDFITVLPMRNGKDALWVVIDRLTKMVHFIACRGTMKPKDFIRKNKICVLSVRMH